MHTSSLGLLPICFCVLLLAGCKTKEKENADVTQLRGITEIKTPIKFDSDRKVKYKAVELENNALIKALNEKAYFTLLGKLFETEDNITILGYRADDAGTPVLVTYNNAGERLSFHPVFENVVADMGRYTSNIVTVLPDKQILFTDSTITRKINEAGTDEVPGTDSLSVTHKKYRITEDGRVEKVN